MRLDDELDTPMGPGPSLDDEVLGGVTSRWQMLTGTDGIDKRGIIVVRVFSCSGRCGGTAGGGIASWSCALALPTVAACSLSFHQL